MTCSTRTAGPHCKLLVRLGHIRWVQLGARPWSVLSRLFLSEPPDLACPHSVSGSAVHTVKYTLGNQQVTRKRPRGPARTGARTSAADPSSQQPASRIIIGARWPDEGSVLEVASPVVIDRTRRGTHDRADVTEPCRGCATAVSCRATSRTSRNACPCPVLLRILHIGGSSLKSPATCESTVLPRPATDVPTPSGQLTCRICPDNSYKLQAEAIRGLQPRSDRTITMATHTCASGGGVPEASLPLPAGRVHPVCTA